MKRRAKADDGVFQPRGEFTRVPGVPERIADEFAHLEICVDSTYEAWPDQFSVPQSRMDHLKLRFFDRAFNVVKGIKILIENSHWELAAPLTRQLFEMVLNLEELDQSDDPDKAVTRYGKFAALQELRHEFANLQHDIGMGRDVEQKQARLDEGQALARKAFPEFWIQTRRGGRWSNSWCGASVKELAQRSEHPLRISQYEVVFRFLSAYGHGAPLAIAGPLDEQIHADDFDRRVTSDDRNTIEIIALTLGFYMEIWALCQPTTPELPGAVVNSSAELSRFMQATNEARSAGQEAEIDER